MKKYLYCYKHIEADIYTRPFFADVEPDNFSEYIKEGLKTSDPETLHSLVSDDLFLIGTFDTLTGTFEEKKEFLVHVGDIAKGIINAHGKTEKDAA